MSVKERLEKRREKVERSVMHVRSEAKERVLSDYPTESIYPDDCAILSLIEAVKEISVASPAEYESEGLKYDLRQVDKDAWRELLVALKAVCE